MSTYTSKQQGSFHIANSLESDQQGEFNVLNTLYTDQQGEFNIVNSFSADQQGEFNIYNSVEADMQGEHNIYNSMESDQQGDYHIYNTVYPDFCGRARIANDALAGYVVYIGEDALPDFTADPDGEGSALPINIVVTPPGAGTKELYVVTRARNKYNIESQNQKAQLITIDTAGDEDLGSISAPSFEGVISVEDEYFKAFVSYAGYNTDTNAADTWRLYVKADTPPVPGTDSVVASGTILNTNYTFYVGPYATGNKTYYFVATVYRSSDGTESSSASTSLVLPADPTTPTAMPGAWVKD